MKFYYVLYNDCTGGNITFQWLLTIKHMRKYRAFSHSFYKAKYNWMNEKLPRFSSVFNVYNRKYLQKETITIYATTHNYYSHAIIHFYILICLNMWGHFCSRLLTVLENIVQNKNITNYTTTHTLHTSLYNFTYNNIFVPYSVDLK